MTIVVVRCSTPTLLVDNLQNEFTFTIIIPNCNERNLSPVSTNLSQLVLVKQNSHDTLVSLNWKEMSEVCGLQYQHTYYIIIIISF